MGRISGQREGIGLVRDALETCVVVLHEVICIVERRGVSAENALVQALPFETPVPRIHRAHHLTAGPCRLGSGWSSGEAEP